MKKQVSVSSLWQLHQSRQLMRGTFLFITNLKQQHLHKTYNMSLIQYIFWVMAAQASFICSVFWAMKCLVYLSVLVIMYQLMKKKWLMKKQVSESFLWQLHQSRQLMRGTFLFITMLKKQSLHKTDTTCHWYSIFLEWWLHKPVSFAVFSAHFRLICQSL